MSADASDGRHTARKNAARDLHDFPVKSAC